MRINTGSPSAPAATQRSSESTATDAVDGADHGATAAAGQAGAAPALQSDVLQPALAALRSMPDIDHDRVAQLRDALARGELPFDPAKLAGLVQRFHGGES